MIPSPPSLRAVELLALSSIFKTPYVLTLRQAVDLPSQDEMEDDEREDADREDWRGGRTAVSSSTGYGACSAAFTPAPIATSFLSLQRAP
jgi:hypothetical protein